jgi:hypothetical protein
MKRFFSTAAVSLLAVLTACAGAARASAQSASADSIPGYPGFDAAVYPGDSAMRAWLYPASPYHWVGDYLPAPCHRDSSFAGKYSAMSQLGWGVAAIYVGQQDWSRMSSAVTTHKSGSDAAAPQRIVCSTTLLSDAQGTTEAADAVARMRADGFPTGSIVYLDIETVTSVSPALLGYMRAWIAGVARDGRYRPGVYAAKANAPDLYPAATAAYRSANLAGAPPFWASSAAGFSLTAQPSAIGLDYATVWQGLFDVPQTWNGVTLHIDVNLATTRSPGSR